MLHVGDLSYANGDPDIWESFLEGLPFAARVPYMVAVGNHEVSGWEGEGRGRRAATLWQVLPLVAQGLQTLSCMFFQLQL